MEGLIRLQTSQRAYRSHVTRIFNKVEETLANEIDELTITYLNTTVAQLEKKKEQIVKLDQQIVKLDQQIVKLDQQIVKLDQQILDLIPQS